MFFVRLLGLFALLLLAGCGSSLGEVSGKVLVDGKPLEEGDIIFEEADNSKTPAGGPIIKGMYTVPKVTPGNKIVRINASRPTKIPNPVMGAAAKESMLGPEYNTQSKLKAQIKAGVQSGVDFEVKALP
jgi:hypothetical protein